MLVLCIRPARPEDDHALAQVDVAAWGPAVSPGPAPTADRFFSEKTTPDDVLVADLDGVAIGYVTVIQPIVLASHAHVLHMDGLAVAPEHRRAGVGHRLVEAAVHRAREREARKLTLRVLARNASARRLYEACGFVIEGILRAEFLLEGAYVDDVLMARHLDHA